jgi:hypothetical protein
VGVHNGKDGVPDTEDDLVLDCVEARWWLDEEVTRENDDDLVYLDAPVVNGLYTPVTSYGPIQSRHQHRGGIGLIGMNASYVEGERTLEARSLLVVTVPDFITHIK